MATSTPWRLVVASGALWATAYNLIWGVAWFAFMRDEWANTMSSVGRENPWVAEVWFLWATLTLPIGVAIMAYAAGHPRPSKTEFYAAVGLWPPMALAMAAWAWQESLPMRVIASDSAVNLVGMVAASLAGGWSVRQAA